LLEVLSCQACGNPVGWRSLQTGADWRCRMAVNLRLAEPATIVAIPLKRFDGRESWETLPDREWHVRNLTF